RILPMDDRGSPDPSLIREPAEDREAPELLRRVWLSRLVLASAAAVLVLAARVARFAGCRWVETARQRNIAEVQRDEITGRMLATLASQALNSGDAGTSMLLALEALPESHSGTVRAYVPQAEAALFAGAARLQETAVLKGHDDFAVYA